MFKNTKKHHKIEKDKDTLVFFYVSPFAYSL